jgi:hypothetical protein
MKKVQLSLARRKFSRHKSLAKFRNIQFNFTFEEWYNWWLSNGIDKNKNIKWTGSNRPCMCRKNDIGPYDVSNVYFSNNVQNMQDRFKYESFLYRWKDDVLPTSQFSKKYNIPSHRLKKYLDRDYFQNLEKETKQLTIDYNRKFKNKTLYEYEYNGTKYKSADELGQLLSLTRAGILYRCKNPDKFGIKQIVHNINPVMSLEDYIKQHSIYPR